MVRQQVRQRWFSRRAFSLHLAIILWFPGCLVAFWWQVNRAFDGNGLSDLYSVEWPVFAIVGVWGWWMLIHTDLDTVGRRAQEKLAVARRQAATADGTGQAAGQATTGDEGDPTTIGPEPLTGPVRRREDEDEALAAYNDRLADLANRGPQTWRTR